MSQLNHKFIKYKLATTSTRKVTLNAHKIKTIKNRKTNNISKSYTNSKTSPHAVQ